MDARNSSREGSNVTRRRLGSAVGAASLATALRITLAVLLAAVALPFLGTGPAYACGCRVASDAAHAKSADAIFTGTLPAESRLGVGSSGPITITFATTRVYKGEVSATQPIVTAGDGAACGLELSGSGPFLVYASRSEAYGEETLSAGLCGGTRAVDKGVPAALGAGREIVAEPVSALGPTTDDEDSSSNLGVLALAGGLLIAGGAVVLTRKRRHP